MSTSNFQWRHDGLRWRIKLMQNTPTASLFYCGARGLSINSSDLKWWMVIPIGQTNAIGTYFIPMIIVIDGYRNTRKGMFRNILTIIEVCLIASILFMGSRSTLVLIGIYLIIRYLVPRAKISKQMMTRMLVIIPIIIVDIVHSGSTFCNRFNDCIINGRLPEFLLQ